MELIQKGDFVIVQRLSHIKQVKLSNNLVIRFGRDTIDFSGIIGEPFNSFFTMTLNGKVYQLKRSEEVVNFEETFLADGESGADNRDIFDGAAFEKDYECAQKLSKDEIETMREQGVGGAKIIESLIKNSSSFSQKTKFSQEKFVKKKLAKYFPYLMIRKPSVRLLAHIFYSNNPLSIMNLRPDTLAQMLNLANVHFGAKYLIFESGCEGLLTAAVLERIWVAPEISTEGKIYKHFQPGSQLALDALNIPKDEQKKYIINLKTSWKKFKSDELLTDPIRDDINGSSALEEKPTEESLVGSLDGLLIACKNHPTNVILKLVKFLSPSRPFVVFCPYKEPLVEAYMELKDTGRAVMVTLSETWCRNYQVLPSRTHPEVMMSGGGGFLLSGIIVDNTEPTGYELASQQTQSNNRKRYIRR